MNIKAILSEKVIPTPVTELVHAPDEEKIHKIEGLMREILLTLGLDLSDDSLQDTPRRVAKMYVSEIFSGLRPENFPKVTVVENKMRYTGALTEANITVNSFCEHHFVPFTGVAHISYIPKSHVLGL